VKEGVTERVYSATSLTLNYRHHFDSYEIPSTFSVNDASDIYFGQHSAKFLDGLSIYCGTRRQTTDSKIIAPKKTDNREGQMRTIHSAPAQQQQQQQGVFVPSGAADN